MFAGQPHSQQHGCDAFGTNQAVTTNGLMRRMIPTSPWTNRLSGFGAAYDAAGNLTAWGGSDSYEYDRLNMTTRRTTGEEDWLFAYTADDQRIWSYRLAGGGSFFTPRDLGGKVLRRFESHLSWGTFTDSIYRGGELLATVDQANTVTHFHLDHLGTPRILTNALGQDIRYSTYYPFGEELFPANDTQPFRFTGHERDLLNTLSVADDHDHMRARDTRPILGRFLSPDKAASWNSVQPQSWNRYSYVAGNPIKQVDPDGNVVEIAWDVANIGYGVYSLVDNLRNGKMGAAALDLGGIVVDSAAAAVPFVPGGAGAAIKSARVASRAADGATGLGSFTRRNFRENLRRVEGAADKADDAHHMIPIAIEGALRDMGVNINIHDPRFGRFWERSAHLRNSREYQRRWERFLRGC